MDVRATVRRATVVACLGAVLLTAGCQDRPHPAGGASGAPAGSSTAPAGPGGSAAPGSPQPPATSRQAPPPNTPPAATMLRPGDRGPAVADLQRRLAELHYWVGAADGVYGATTQQAVYAVQKAAGLTRDGTAGARTRAALASSVQPKARSTSGRLVEVDLDRQLLLLVDGGRVQQVFNTSTGTYQYYTYQGTRHLADTPRGRWSVYRQVDGWDDGPLGQLYRPKYFNQQGIAIHGYPSVPPTAASHGCVRVSLPAMDWLWASGQLPTGTQVWVY